MDVGHALCGRCLQGGFQGNRAGGGIGDKTSRIDRPQQTLMKPSASIFTLRSAPGDSVVAQIQKRALRPNPPNRYLEQGRNDKDGKSARGARGTLDGDCHVRGQRGPWTPWGDAGRQQRQQG